MVREIGRMVILGGAIGKKVSQSAERGGVVDAARVAAK
jgi:hypothetical protein